MSHTDIRACHYCYHLLRLHLRSGYENILWNATDFFYGEIKHCIWVLRLSFYHLAVNFKSHAGDLLYKTFTRAFSWCVRGLALACKGAASLEHIHILYGVISTFHKSSSVFSYKHTWKMRIVWWEGKLPVTGTAPTCKRPKTASAKPPSWNLI